MSCNKHDCRPYPVEPAPYAPGGCGPCKPGPRPGHCPPPPPPCPPSQYIGARYVPKFADPLEWDGAKAYENLIIVTHNNESYTSRCPVPPGIDITNERYWAKTGAYNAQLEQLKEGVSDLSSQVTGFAEDNKEFRAKIEQYDKDNAAMKNTVAKNDARVDALSERVATAETEIDGLQATTAQHTTEIADLHAKDEDLQRQITSNDNDISAIQAKDVQQDSRLDGIDTKLKSHDATLAQNTADIAKNTKNIQDNAAQIAVNAHELADHAEELKDHEARLTAQHKEITDNHTAIERNTSDIASLRSDLTEDEAKIEANRDAIAHIQEKDVQQDGRLDALEKRTTTAEGRLDGLDTKTDATNTALTAEVDRAKAAELEQGKLIAKNAAELATHATELADHEQRITALESDNTTNKADIADIKAKNTQQDTAISGNTDAIQHINDSLTGYVKTEVYTAGQAAQDAIIGDWTTDHPGQTVSQCATSQETELAEHAGQIAKLETDKADRSEIPDTSDFVTLPVYTNGQNAQDAEIAKRISIRRDNGWFVMTPYMTEGKPVGRVTSVQFLTGAGDFRAKNEESQGNLWFRPFGLKSASTLTMKLLDLTTMQVVDIDIPQNSNGGWRCTSSLVENGARVVRIQDLENVTFNAGLVMGFYYDAEGNQTGSRSYVTLFNFKNFQSN